MVMNQQGTMHCARIDTRDIRAINQGHLVSERYVIDSPGVLETWNKFVTSWKFQRTLLRQHKKTYQKSSKIPLVLVPEIGVIRGK